MINTPEQCFGVFYYAKMKEGENVGCKKGGKKKK